MKNIYKLLIILSLIISSYFGYIYITKINYLDYLVKSQKDKILREDLKSIKLKKEAIFFTKSSNYKKAINLNLYKDYFIINGSFCDIENEFFLEIQRELRERDIVFKPKINNFGTENIENNIAGRKIKLDNLKINICNFIQGKENIKSKNIEIEIQNYNISKEELTNINNFILVGEYKIDKYEKTPSESVINSQILINKISNEIIYPGENISLLEKLLNKGGSDLLESNILKDGEIIKGIGGGSCLASSIIYRTLLNSGIKIISQKTHNIYYENIYGIEEIGLDSTIYEDENYYIDLVFENNYENPIIIIPEYTKKYIELKIYSKQKDFTTKLKSLTINNKDLIKWEYQVFDKNNAEVSKEILISKYDEIDDY
ncbi:MAG: VanW family protein [Candidatus Gracilibacteria bacterium]|nr:VanW family protein [Candidatus Gracilibacteria bacterium]MDQ7022118.1 VanW family protein [Candidatus Gracilibacteria bacterium]